MHVKSETDMYRGKCDRILPLFALSLVFLPATCLASGLPSDETITPWPDMSAGIDAIFQGYDRPYHPGGITAVLFEDKLIHLKAYGAANREFDVRWTADTRYRIASMGKSMMANLFLMLEDQGLLSLDDPVGKYLPEFPDYGVPLNLRHLLSMNSGLWQDEHIMVMAGAAAIDSLDSMYQLSIRQRQLDYAPGSYERSTDVNFRILARILEKVTGKPFPEAMVERFFKPLGMNSSLAPPNFAKMYDSQATTYTTEPERTWPPNQIRIGIPLSGAGSIISTMNDVVTWLMQVTAKADDGRSYFDRMTAPWKLPDGEPAAYRLGAYRVEHRGLVGWGHGGHTGAYYVHFPEINLTVAYFTNYLGGINGNKVLRGIIDAFLKSEHNPHRYYLSADNPDRDHLFLMPFEPIPEVEVSALVGRYVDFNEGNILTLGTTSGNDIRFGFLSPPGQAYLLKAGPGHYHSDFGTILPKVRIEVLPCDGCTRPSLAVQNLDWAAPRSFDPVNVAASNDISLGDYVARYYSEELDAFHSVRAEETKLVLRFGAGLHGMQRFILTALGKDVFEAHSAGFGEIAENYLAVKFLRNPEGRIYGMRLNAYSVRNLVLQRVN